MAFNLGTIESKVKVDGLAQFGDDLKKADATMDAFAQQTSRRMTRVETDIKAMAKATGQSAQQMQTQIDRALKSVSADTATKSLERMARQMGLSSKEVQSLGRQIGLSAQTVENLTEKLAGAGSGMSALVSISKPLAGAIAGIFSIGAITNAINEIANVKMQFEAFDRTLKMVTGSQTSAALAMESLAATSDRLGLRLTDAANGYKLIGAAAKGTTLEGTAAKNAFEGIASAASVLGMSASDANGVMLALSQVISKGKVQAEELRGQIGERLPGAFQIAARAMGMTTVELDKLMSTGGLFADDFVPKFAAELQKTFGQGATEAGNSTQAAFNRMQNAWDQLKAALGDTTGFKGAIAVVNAMGSAADWAANKLRSASGTFQGLKQIEDYENKIKGLQTKIDGGEFSFNPFQKMFMGGFSEGVENTRLNEAKAKIEEYQSKITKARQDIEDAARDQAGKVRQNAANKMQEQEVAAIKGGEKATLDAWAASSDKKIALWASQQKEVAEAYQKAYKGEITEGAMGVLIDEANKKYAEGMENLGKKGAKGANAAARYAEQTFGYLQQAQDQFDQLTAQLGGDSLGAKFAAIDKRYDAAAVSISKSMIGAKGATDDARAALEQLEQNRALEKQIAAGEAWKKTMSDAANMLGELGRLTGDPDALYGASMTTAQAWEADQKKRIGAIEDEAEREKQLGELRQVMTLKEVEVRRQAYEGVAAVSSKYWDAEKERIEAHLEVVKSKADNELAYKIYAAQEWDEYNKRLLEQQAATAGTFGETLAAKLSLAYGGYKSEATRAKESWVATSDAIVNATDGAFDAVAGGLGDTIRNFGDGCVSIEDLWQNMLARMADAAASFLEDWAKRSLKDLAAGWFSGATNSSSPTQALAQAAGGSGGFDLPSFAALFKGFGKDAGHGLGEYFSTAGTSQGLMVAAGSKNYLSDIITDGFDASKMGANAWKSQPVDAISTATQAGTYASGIGSLASTGTSLLSTIGSTLGVVGAAAGLVGLAVSLFGQEEPEPTKTASGYNVNYGFGKTYASGVDFYSDGSVQSTGISDPDVTRQISQAFKDAAENLSDFADVLGFTAEVLDGFQMPSMNITSDQLDGYIRNGTNAMAFQALEAAGLRGAFDALAEDGEAYIDQIERLAAAYSTGAGKLSAYGYEMADVAQITQEQIEALRAKTVETAAGTSDAIMAMAQSMGATSSQLAELAANASDGSQALAVTDEQLSNLLEADWMSKVLDNVGGEEAFNAIMDTLLGNVFDSIDAYAANLDYYDAKAQTAISKLGDAGITVDNFWEKFNAALKNGLDPDQFELWSKASTWVNSIDMVNAALSDWNDAMTRAAQNLDQRMTAAQGFDYQAKLAKQMADAEWELAAAREAGYDAAYLSRLQAVQAAELAATEAKHQQDYADAVLDAQNRIATATDDKLALIAIQRKKNDAEYQQYAKEFTLAPGHDDTLFRALQEAAFWETANALKEIADALNEATEAMTRDLAVREAEVSGNEALAGAIRLLNEQQDALSKAREDGLDEDLIARLVTLQTAEYEQYLASIDSSIVKVELTLSQLKDSLIDEMNALIDSGIEAYSKLSSESQSLAAEYYNAAKNIYSALQSWAIEDNGTRTSAEGLQANTALFDATYRKALTGDTDALASLSGLGGSLREAAQGYYGNKDDYESFYRELQSKMGSAAFLADSLGDEKTGLAKLYDVQVNLYELLRDELGKDDPNTELLERIGVTMGQVKTGIDTGAGYQETLKEITGEGSGGDGGFGAIRAAISSTGTNTNALLSQIGTSQATLNSLLAGYLKTDIGAALQQKVDLLAAQVANSTASEVDIFRTSEIGAMLAPLGTVYLQPRSENYDPETAMIQFLTSGYMNHQWEGTWLDQFKSGRDSASNVAAYYEREAAFGSYTGTFDWAELYSYLKEYMASGAVAWNGWDDISDLYGYVIDNAMAERVATTQQLEQDYQLALYEWQNWQEEQESATTVNTLAARNGVATTVSSDDTVKMLLETVKELKNEIKGLRAETQHASHVKIVAAEKTVSILNQIVNDDLQLAGK
ncbi:tape measure protein [Solidesulfovibrio sp.]